MLAVVFWMAVVCGAAAAAAAFYGRYLILPAWLTGPSVCKLEEGGCAVLFRTPDAALLGVPNSLLGLVFYPIVGFGRLAGWPFFVLLCGATIALAMTVRLVFILLRGGLECRVCWLGHLSNAAIWSVLAIEIFSMRK